MILSQPGAWSAEPSGLRSAPWNSCTESPRVMPLVLGRARRSGRGATGGADHIRSSLSVVQMDAAPVSTAAVASSRPREHPEGPPSAWSVVGGCYIKNWVRDPITWQAALRAHAVSPGEGGSQQRVGRGHAHLVGRSFNQLRPQLRDRSVVRCLGSYYSAT